MEHKIPRTDEELLVWSQNFVKCLEANNEELKVGPKKIKDLAILTEKFEKALRKVKDLNHIRTDFGEKNEIRTALRKSIRQIIATDLAFNPAMNEKLEYAMKLSIFRAPRRKPKNPDREPRIVVIPGIGMITVVYYDAVTGRKAKPAGVKGIEFYWDLLDRPPVSPEELSHKVTRTSGSLVVNFTEGERGKAFYVAARWINSVNETGPWSEIKKVYIG